MVDSSNGSGAGYLAGLPEEEKRKRKAWNFFGFEIRRSKETEELESSVRSFVPPAEENDSSYVVSSGGFYGQTIDVRGDVFTSERDLIFRYRNAAMQPEVDRALEDIVNEAIVSNDYDLPISLNMDFLDLDDDVKKKIEEEFIHILKLLEFRKYGHDIFKRWYIDGRVVYHNVIDTKNPHKGLIELRPINPVKIKKIKEVKEEIDPRTRASIIVDTEEYYVYSEEGFTQNITGGSTNYAGAQQGLKLAKDSVTYVTSGILDSTRRTSLSHLHKALRNINQLRMMEESLLIYRFSRAPERRLFNIDTGDLPRDKAMKYVSELAAKYKNKLIYDAQSGEIKDGQHHIHMQEDFWLPKTASGKGTTIDQLPGGQNLGEIEDIEYFQKKLYQALNVPINRLDSESSFNLGRSTEITRDEVKFQKFIDKIRMRFAELFKSLLRTQLILRGVIKEGEWDEIRENILIDYQKDSFFSELKESEILRERIETLNAAKDHIGIFFSKDYVRKHILHQTEDEISEIKAQIRKEALTNDSLPQLDQEGGGGFGGGAPSGGGGDFGGDFGGDTDFDLDGDPEAAGDEQLGEPDGAATTLGADADGTDLSPEQIADTEAERNDKQTAKPKRRGG